MKDLLEKNNSIKPVQIGKIVEGKIIGKARSAVFLDLGPMGTGIIYGREFQEVREEIKNLKIGNSLFAKILSLENEDGYIELSLNQASDELTWEKLRQQKDKDEMLTVKISGVNKGGLLAEVFGIPAFLPVSQLLPENYPRVEKGDALKIVGELQKFVGQEMEVKIFDLDPRQGKLILSEKAKENEKIKEILKNYEVGDIVEGEITGLTDFGVFMKFGKEKDKLEGLIHISELDWQLIENPADIVKIGEKVKAKIISIADNKISLSLKVLKKDPWQEFEKKYDKGDIVEGKVSKFNPYGAFIQITSKIQGLCHISEFGTKTKMEETLKIGEKYKFQILSLNSGEHRMSLKLV
ncbi:MAG TPA: S1 RNA-binding domain-containing protein [Patescibacteria group bacterium]|nr:S1 RNA-binding domain-containing protein [Patescibacteria group bacterium]